MAMALSDKISEARTAAGLTQSELARRLGIKPQSVQAWESGVSAPRARRLTQVAEVLGVSQAFLFEGTTEQGGGAESEGGKSATGSVQMAQALADRLIASVETGAIDQHAISVMGDLLDLLTRR